MSEPAVDTQPGRRAALRLVLLSCLMLFLELTLIRLASAMNVYVRFFTNFVLLGSFLGIGLGFLRARRGGRLFGLLPFLLLIAVAFLLAFPVAQGQGSHGGSLRGLFDTPALPQWISLPVLFVLVVLVMASVAEGVAGTFVAFRPLEAYRLDITGSILGIVAFTTMSFLGLPPAAWMLVAALLVGLSADWRLSPGRWGALGLAIGLLGIASAAAGDHWSPYYRVTVGDRVDSRIPIRVNGLPHQSIWDLDDLLREQPFYNDPYRHLAGGPLDHVLIVGAGSGNDVALALRRGARHVDAVEIDPVLYDLGRKMHPERPYSDPRVTAHIQDGRAFLEQTDERYDLVLFALPDSLVLVSGQGALRLESYLFTREAFESVRDHLAPDGVFSIYNYYRPDVFSRYARTMADVFGSRPCLDNGLPGADARRQAVLTVGASADSVRCTERWTPAGALPEPATDDHPFPYVHGRSLPAFYLFSLLLVLAGSFLAVWRFGGLSLAGARRYLDLFWMGAAFLLLETKSVVQFALLFGTTWLVNSLVFAGVLLSVYLAIEVAGRARLRRPDLLYVALLGSLVVGWAVTPDHLLALGPVPRFAAATVLTFSPIFLANLIFAQRFRSVAASGTAFGMNLLGAVFGGVLEYSAVIVGYRNLLVLVGLLYTLAYVTNRRLGAAEEVRAGFVPAGAG